MMGVGVLLRQFEFGYDVLVVVFMMQSHQREVLMANVLFFENATQVSRISMRKQTVTDSVSRRESGEKAR